MDKRKRLLTAVAGLTLYSLVLSSCAPAAAPTPASQPSPPPKAATAAEATPKPAAPAPTAKPAADQPQYGGILFLPTLADPPNLDIHQNVTIYLFAPGSNTCNGLVKYDSGSKVLPDLAESWDISADGKIYTFALRKGVKFHDGKPFSSADAKISLERIMNYDGLKFQVETIDKVEAPAESTLKVTLKQRQAAFLPLIGSGRTLMGPKHIIDAKGDLKRDLIGTGPFKLKEYISGTSFRLEKNSDYFVKGQPYLDGIAFYIIKDPATRFASFRAGRLQIYGHPPVHTELGRTNSEILKRDMPQAVIRPYETATGYGLMPNWNRAPWSDVRVRRAAFLAVDRQKGLEVVSEGIGLLGVSLFYGEWALPNDELTKMPGIRQPKDQDLAEAKRLLADAGYAQGFKSTALVRAADPLYEKAATFLADQLSKIGIDLKLDIIDYALWNDARSRLNFDTMLVINAMPLTDPDSASRYISRKLGGQFASSDDDKILELFAKQSQAANVDERKQTVFELQRRIAEVVPHIMVAWQNQFIAFWPNVKGYDAQGGVYSHNNLEGIWLAK